MDKERLEFESWLASKKINLAEYKDDLPDFTIAMFGSYPDKHSFKLQLLDQITLKNELVDPPKFFIAYDIAHQLSKSGM